MKRIVFCFDGTTNELSAKHPTNVVLVAEGIAPTARDGVTQIIHYDQGVGTNEPLRWRGIAFGAGLLNNVAEAYRFLIFNYEAGDKIFVLGFSRGAFTARSFIGLMRQVGVIDRRHAGQINNALELYASRDSEAHPDSEAARQFRSDYSSVACVDAEDDAWRCRNAPHYVSGQAPLLKVAYLGVWDTVGAMGIPEALPGSKYVNQRHRFHNASLSTLVDSARHAVAIDERRRTFPPVLWENLSELNNKKGFAADAGDAPYQQQWFPGTHGSVGGGWPIRKLSDGALDWVMDGAKNAGLNLDATRLSQIHTIRPDHRGPLGSSGGTLTIKQRAMGAVGCDRTGPSELHEVSLSARKRWAESAPQLPEGQPYRPAPLVRLASLLDDATSSFWTEARVLEPRRLVTLGVESIARQHLVKPGDLLSTISSQYLGSTDHFKVIFEVNRDRLDNPDKLTVGTELRIPRIQAPRD